MLEVPATEISRRFSHYRRAAHLRPVAVTHRGQVTEVLISKQVYDDYVRLKSLATRALWASEISPEAFQALVEARMDPRHDHLDRLLDE